MTLVENELLEIFAKLKTDYLISPALLKNGFFQIVTSKEFVQGIFALLKRDFKSDKIDYVLTKILPKG